MRDKHNRRSNDKKHKHRHHSKSPERSRRRSSSSSSKSSPDREKKNKSKVPEKPTPIASTSSSQKSPMISLATVQQPQTESKIELPAYYNPNVINLTKFAEQQKKRKLLWGNKKVEPAKDAAKWGGAFSQDTDGTKASKFMRLMGIKDG